MLPLAVALGLASRREAHRGSEGLSWSRWVCPFFWGTFFLPGFLQDYRESKRSATVWGYPKTNPFVVFEDSGDDAHAVEGSRNGSWLAL